MMAETETLMEAKAPSAGSELWMQLASEIGLRMASSGAETYRVEESVVRILSSCGLNAQVYAVPNSLFVSVTAPDSPPLTVLHRISRRGTDLEAVEQYSNLSRRICSEHPSPETAKAWLRETEARCKNYPFFIFLLGHMLVAGGFCVFFGGTARDCLAAALCGLLLGAVLPLAEKQNTNVFFQKLLSSFLMGFFLYSTAALGLSDHVDTAIIGTLMLLVPGILFTNAMRDIIFGDTNSGINRIVEVLLIAAAIALGTAAAWNAADGLWSLPLSAEGLTYSPLVTCIASFFACLGFVWVFNIHGTGSLVCALGGTAVWAVYCLVLHFGAGELVAYFFATVFAAVFAEIMARVRKYPAISYLTISLLPLIPGAGIYYTARQAVSGISGAVVSQGAHTLAIAGVMAAGILVVSTGARWFHAAKHEANVRNAE
ncbi:MAG: threonine/serine exporter family protein [Clostridia bacterium]|nr:threonine/serine exporter family protein [Clostridia bacterium]